MIQLDLFAGLSFTIIILWIKYSYNRKSLLPLPPGPKKLPVIGNLLDMSANLAWITYHNWCEEFNSDIIHLDVAGTSIVVLDTAEAAWELLEKKSSIYSGRPRMPMLRELMGWEYAFGLMPYGASWREHRKLMHHALHPGAAKYFRPQERQAAHRLLHRLLDGPDKFMDYIRLMTGEIIMSITYGIKVLPKGDPYITIAEKASETVSSAVIPGAFLVDALPILKYVPDWMPFAGFKRKAKEWKKLALAMRALPFDAVKRNIADGKAMPSFVSRSLDLMNETRDLAHQESVIKSTAGQMYLGGADTTLSVIYTCILGLLSNPDALKKAQQEIDLVVGHSRLPDFDDENSLPYVTAIVKETVRWRNIAPIGMPHLVSADDEYKGYRIPTGSIVISNLWAILNDETIYPDPFNFKPERFIKNGKLNPEVRDPISVAFGFGRRICPGRFMALSTVWITVASMIAVFDISKAVGDDGKVIEPTYEYHSGLVYSPLPFKCSIKARSKQMEQLVREYANE